MKTRRLRVGALTGAVIGLLGAAAGAQQPAVYTPAPVGDCTPTPAQVAQAEKQGGDSVKICASTAIAFHSVAEGDAFHALQSLQRAADTTPTAMDAAVAKFEADYPQSDFLGESEGVAVRYYLAHGNYAAALTHGQQALARDPDNLYALSATGSLVASRAQASDIDYDTELNQVEQNANRLLALCAALQWDAHNGMDFRGRHYSPDEALAMQHAFQAAAYAALGRVALSRNANALAVVQYGKALELETPAASAVDHFYRGQAEARLGQNAAATDDYRAASANAGGNGQLATMAQKALAGLPH